MKQNKITKTKVIVIRATPEYKERVDKEAENQNITTSTLVSMAINKILPKKGN
jgi:predicted DNA-binding protein